MRVCVLPGACPYWSQRQAGECVRDKLMAADLMMLALRAGAAPAGGWGSGAGVARTSGSTGTADAPGASDTARGAASADTAGEIGITGHLLRKERLDLEAGQRPVLFLASDTSDEDLDVFLSMIGGRRVDRCTPLILGSAASTGDARNTGSVGPEAVTKDLEEGRRGSLNASEGNIIYDLFLDNRIEVVRMPPLSGHPWAEELRQVGADKNGGVVAMVEKLVCALSSVFLTSPGSTFSQHIMGLRQAMRTASCMDGAICKGVKLYQE